MNIDELPQVADALSNLEKSVEALRSATEELGGGQLKKEQDSKSKMRRALMKAIENKKLLGGLMILKTRTESKKLTEQRIWSGN